MKLRVSIVILNLNHGKYLERCIQSALEQNYKDLEVIVIDGGSQDNSVEILRRYDNYIKWVSEPDNGQGDAVRKGLDIAMGDLITILSSDDLLYPNVISKIVRIFNKNKKYGIIFGDLSYIDEKGDYVVGFVKSHIRRKIREQNNEFKKVINGSQANYIFHNILKNIFIIGRAISHRIYYNRFKLNLKNLITRKIVLPTSSLFFRRDVYIQSDLDKLSEITICPDFYLWTNMALQTKMKYIPLKILKCRKHIEAGSFDPKQQESISQALNHNLDLFFSNPNVPLKYKTVRLKNKAYHAVMKRRDDYIKKYSDTR